MNKIEDSEKKQKGIKAVWDGSQSDAESSEEEQ